MKRNKKLIEKEYYKRLDYILANYSGALFWTYYETMIKGLEKKYNCEIVTHMLDIINIILKYEEN